MSSVLPVVFICAPAVGRWAMNIGCHRTQETGSIVTAHSLDNSELTVVNKWYYAEMYMCLAYKNSNWTFKMYLFHFGLWKDIFILSKVLQQVLLSAQRQINNVFAGGSEWNTLIGRDPSRYCVLIGWDHGVATPAFLSHKEPDQGTQSPLLGAFLALRSFFMA